ncbi:AKNA [Lepeophtheirus salmonis]|uniref:AKNA n=1 Tax=Lepeophtheirus salmonis TaxID=72036 RepID=A0A7R8CD79_LEPSM|nr:AKNA [Lepeophtheirus salmonis]CAF2778417.1 AKNA [Lepeophtheirus salmonis]
MSFLSSSRTNNEGESSRGEGGVRSFLSSIVEKKQDKYHPLNHYTQDKHKEEIEEDELSPYKSINFSGDEEEEEESSIIDPINKDFCFFDSLTKKWVNFEDFSEVPSVYDESVNHPSLRMWDESLSKIEEVTECSTGRGVESKQRFILPLNSSLPRVAPTKTNFLKFIWNEPAAINHIYPRLNRTLPSSRRSSIDESVESFPINYSKSSYNSNVVNNIIGGGVVSGGKITRGSRPPGGSYHNSPALERRRKKTKAYQNFSRSASSNLNKNKSYSSGNISVKSDYSHVQSKVKAYIKSIKDLPKKPDDFSSFQTGKKSLSMSNLSSSRYFPSTSGVGGQYPLNSSSSNIAASNLKSFLSYANLDEMTITVNKYNAKSADNLNSKSKFDTSRISRLLDNISDEEAMEEVIDSAAEDDEIVIDVENILSLALNERRDKQEAKKVLSQLQTNYDRLQRKYAEAENTIDKLRFASTPTLPKDFLNYTSTHNTSSNNSSSIKLNNEDLLSGISNPRVSSPINQKEKYEITKQALVDIQDQLYGLEILSDTLDPKEKESAMEDVRRSFHSILVNFDNQRGSGLNEGSKSDSDMVELLKQIGKKLYVKEPKVPPIPNEKQKEFLDPFEKVSNWKTTSASGSPTPRIDSVSSYAGNTPSKPISKIADILLRQQNNDFDSGCCPGSERSVRSKESHYRHKNPDGTRLLPYNNYFKKKSHPSSSIIESSSTTTSIQEEEDDDEVQSSTSKRQIKRVDTDLSSSEEEEEEDPSSNRQPKVLVQQINQDINELPAIPGDIFVVDESQLRPPSSSSRRSLSSLHFAAVSSSSPPVSPGGTRRVPPGSGPWISPLHSRYLSQSQSLRRCGHIGQVRKKFDSEDTAEDVSMDDREIRRIEFERRRKSKLTKRRSRENILADSEFVEDGRDITGEGERRIFIPKLKIEDLWTDRTGEEDNIEDEKEGFSSSASSSNPNNVALSTLKEGKKKPNKEIKELLRSLEHANKMATKLKERSEEMLTVLKSEMASSNSNNNSNSNLSANPSSNFSEATILLER